MGLPGAYDWLVGTMSSCCCVTFHIHGPDRITIDSVGCDGIVSVLGDSRPKLT
jgi:hypothetical protein